MTKFSENNELYDTVLRLVNVAFDKLEKGKPLNVNRLTDLDLTPRRYTTFVRILGHSRAFSKCLSLLQHLYGRNHSPDLIVNLLADLVYKVISPALEADETQDYHQILSREYSSFISELRQPNWTIQCVAALFNLHWEVPENGSEYAQMTNVVGVDELGNVHYQRLMPRVRLVPDELGLIGAGFPSEFGISDVETWCEVTYRVPKSNVEYAELIQPDRAKARVERALLAMRLFQLGDVGSNLIGCKIYGKSTWPEVLVPLNFKVPTSAYFAPYNISLTKKTSLDLLSFADQLDLVIDAINDRQIKIACEDFMASYSRDPVDRLEGYMRTLQALFMRRGDPLPKLSKRVSKFLARDEEQIALVEKKVRESYGLRSRVSHGNLAPSELQKTAIEKIPFVEQYCRESIFFFISLSWAGELDSILKRLYKDELSLNEMKETRRKAKLAFWSNRRIITKTRDGKEVFLILWPE